MSAVADRYRTLAASMEDRIRAVPDDRWSNASPCEGWTARDVVRHLVETPPLFFGFVEVAPPEVPSVDDDPVAAFTTMRDAVQAALEDPAIADKGFDGMFGPSTFAEGVDRFLCADLVVHAWDLARATGQDEQLPADEVGRVFEALRPMDEQMRGPGAFGPKVEPPADADEQTRFLSFLGRQV